MVTSVIHDARIKASDQADLCEGERCFDMPQEADQTPRKLSASKTTLHRRTFGEAIVVATAALCLVLVPSVQSLGQSVEKSGAFGTGTSQKQILAPEVHADRVTHAEVARLVAAE